MTEALTLDPASTALLVVDMQNDFCHPDGYYAQRAPGRSHRGGHRADRRAADGRP